jgi:GGDEF domain-containing protein
MTKDEILALVHETSNEAINRLEQTDTPAYPNYYNLAFVEILKDKYQGDFETLHKIISKYLFEIDSSSLSEEEKRFQITQSTINEYTQTTSTIKEISEKQKDVLDLSTLEASSTDNISTIIHELNDTHTHLSDEIRRAEAKITELEEGLEKIEFESDIDRITKLPMLKVFDKNFSKIVASADDRELDLFVMAIGIDHCDMLSAEYGYVVADKIQLYLTKTIDNATRIEHQLYKDNQGRFLLLLNRIEVMEVESIANRIKLRIKSSKLMYANFVINLSVSIAIVNHKKRDTSKVIKQRATKLLDEIMQDNTDTITISLGE